VNELYSKLKSAELDRDVIAHLESPTDPHSLAFVGGSGAKTNANPFSGMYSLSSLMSLLDEEFDVLGEHELALLTWRFERMHENRVNSRRNSRTCFKCGKTGHFFTEYLKVNNHDKHKSKDRGRRSEKKEHEHGRKTRTREKIKSSINIDSGFEDVSSSSSDDKKKKKKKKNFGKYLNGLYCAASKISRSYNKKDGLCGMAHSSISKRSQKNTYNSEFDSEDDVCDELSSLCKENEELVDLLDNHDHMLREANKLRKELRALLEDARTRVAELETQVLAGKHEIDSLKASHVVSNEVDYADCSVFLVDLTALWEKHASKCEEQDVLRVQLAELKSRHTLLGACTSCLVCMKKLLSFILTLFCLRLI
jgi:ElaB/YqjD/DUF883 family membrane-anchored ribosome-binding protein